MIPGDRLRLPFRSEDRYDGSPMDILFVGHVCVDKNVVGGQTETLYGGGVVHGAITAQRCGISTAVLTKCAETDRPGFQHLSDAGVRTVFLPSPSSTSIRNVYPSANPDERQSRLISRADPFCEEDLGRIAELAADVVHLNPLWFGEFPVALIPSLRRQSPFLAADAQGFLRVAEPDGRMVYRDLEDKRAVLSLLDLFKVDSKEALLLTGEEDPERAARAVHALGPRLVLLTHQGGVCVFDGRSVFSVMFTGWTLEGRTGRGDTCTASFLAGRRRGMSLPDATSYAAAVTSAKMQYRGPYRGPSV
jgi:sugar/nucleoside kinase (ribokinase family)